MELATKLMAGNFLHGIWVILLGWFCCVFNAQAITGVNPSEHPSVETLPLPMVHRINLEQAVAMVLKTDIGQQFKPDIAELAKQGKIRLTPLNAQHYGESGEGCVIRDGKYHYEGYFIILNEALSIPELASSLVHETDHYRQIKRINQENPTVPIKIGWLESSAFATQLGFIEALEKQGLADRKALFVEHRDMVFGVMAAAQKNQQTPNPRTYSTAIAKLLEFGYPPAELERTLVVKDPAQCKGPVTTDRAASILHN